MRAAWVIVPKKPVGEICIYPLLFKIPCNFETALPRELRRNPFKSETEQEKAIAGEVLETVIWVETGTSVGKVVALPEMDWLRIAISWVCRVWS